jgi:hypothetical protein
MSICKSNGTRKFLVRLTQEEEKGAEDLYLPININYVRQYCKFRVMI